MTTPDMIAQSIRESWTLNHAMYLWQQGRISDTAYTAYRALWRYGAFRWSEMAGLPDVREINFALDLGLTGTAAGALAMTNTNRERLDLKRLMHHDRYAVHAE